MTAFLVVFLAGLAGSFHCVGMCGGFACTLGAGHGSGRAMAMRHVAYNGGRLLSYVFLGAMAGWAGRAVCGPGLSAADLTDTVAFGQRLFAVLAGLLMIAMALQILGVHRRGRSVGIDLGPLAATLRPLLSAPGPAAPLAFGVLNGFLPCPLVYAFLAQSAAGADPGLGAAIMAAFGAGTLPAMLIIGMLGRLAGPAGLRRGVAVAGCFVLVLGVVTAGRGFLPMLHAAGAS